ncbi:Pyruvate/Phosphoenolpyruvate kinase-like domain-containing protein [Aspergillus falconensis]
MASLLALRAQSQQGGRSIIASCGVAGFRIEDQVSNKRWGHLREKEVVDVTLQVCVIRRDSIHRGSNIVIIARTDASAVEGYEAALEQYGVYYADTLHLIAARECGANMGFLEAIETEEQIKNAVNVLAPIPLSVNLITNSKTPWFSPEQLGEWSVKLEINPGAAGKSVLHTIRRAYRYLLGTGKDDAAAQGLDPKGFFDGVVLFKDEV